MGTDYDYGIPLHIKPDDIDRLHVFLKGAASFCTNMVSRAANGVIHDHTKKEKIPGNWGYRIRESL